MVGEPRPSSGAASTIMRLRDQRSRSEVSGIALEGSELDRPVIAAQT